MSFKYLSGADANFINAATLSQTGTENANFPLSNLNRLFAWEVFRYDSASLNDSITADLGSAKACDYASVHFHNIDSGVTAVKLQSDDNAGFSSPTDRATFTVASPTFYATFASASERYWRFLFEGTNGSALYFGGLSLGAASTLTRTYRPNWSVNYAMPQATGPSGARANRSLFPRRSVSLPFVNTTEAQKAEVLAMMTDCKWGEEPVVCSPNDPDENFALYARPTGEWGYQRGVGSVDDTWQHTVDLAEDRFPVITT